MPGSTPPTSQLDWLSSTTAMIVLLWSRATRDLLKSFGWGIATLHRLHAATKLPRPRRPPHRIFQFPALSKLDAICPPVSPSRGGSLGVNSADDQPSARLKSKNPVEFPPGLYELDDKSKCEDHTNWPGRTPLSYFRKQGWL